MESILYSQEGKEIGKITLPERVFNAPWNADLVHQVVTSMKSSARRGTAHTKDRSEVRGGGRKPWQQKGTGRARHGSSRSPLWSGGGVTHGPRNVRNFKRKINRKAKTAAFYVLLSRKFQDGEVMFIEGLNLSAPKTKMAKKILVNLSAIEGFGRLVTKKQNAVILALGNKDETASRSFRNISNILIDETRNLNPVKLLESKYVIIVDPRKSLPILESRVAVK